MAFFSKEVYPVQQAVGTVSTTKQNLVGTRIRASDPTYGDGEFIYLPGVASTVVGSLVTYDPYLGTTTLCPSTANLAQPLAVATAATINGTWGWYQISGAAVVATNGTLSGAGVPVYIGTVGTVTSTGAAGKQVVNAISSTATGTPAANQAVVTLNQPFAQGAIT